MNELITAEDALLAEAKAALSDANGKVLVRVELLPGDIREPDTLRQIAGAAPAVYLAPLGGPVAGNPDNMQVPFVWSWLFVTNHAAGQQQQLRGDARALGAYQLMQLVLPKINGMTIPGVGTVAVRRIENLFSARTKAKGISMWAAPCSVKVPMPINFDLSALDAFLEATADHQIADGNEPAAVDNVQLEQ